MENEKIFDLMTQMYSEMQKGIKDVQQEMRDGFKKVDERFNKVENRLDKIEIKLEHDVAPKIQILFDGHTQHTEQLTRIENEVKKDYEVILRRVK